MFKYMPRFGPGQTQTNIDLESYGYSAETLTKLLNALRVSFRELDPDIDEMIEYCEHDFRYLVAVFLYEAKLQGLKLE